MVAASLESLISRLALGDRKAFTLVYDQTAPKLFGVISRILRDRAEAEDALQEVYVKIWQNAAKFQASGHSPFAWLVTIARNHAIDRVRSRRAPSVDIDEVVELQDHAPNPEGVSMAADDRTRIENCMEKLEPDRAAAVYAAYVEGYSYQELAERFNLNLNTLRTWLRRSLISLKECLER